jgi:uncharacterized short protein YbdD (DUF466 family)
MKTSADVGMPADPRDAADVRAGAPSRQARLAAVLEAARSAYLQVFGIPDYERYLAHMTQAHPGEAPLSRREFCARAIDRKYNRNGPRCC